MDRIHSGWLTKSPPESKSHGLGRIFKSQWRRRFFVLYAPPILNTLTRQCNAQLDYYDSDRCTKKKGSINLANCDEVLTSLDSAFYKYLFALHTVDRDGYEERTYHLAADTEEEMEKWANMLCIQLGLADNKDQIRLPLISISTTEPPQTSSNRPFIQSPLSANRGLPESSSSPRRQFEFPSANKNELQSVNISNANGLDFEHPVSSVPLPPKPNHVKIQHQEELTVPPFPLPRKKKPSEENQYHEGEQVLTDNKSSTEEDSDHVYTNPTSVQGDGNNGEEEAQSDEEDDDVYNHPRTMFSSTRLPPGDNTTVTVHRSQTAALPPRMKLQNKLQKAISEEHYDYLPSNNRSTVSPAARGIETPKVNGRSTPSNDSSNSDNDMQNQAATDDVTYDVLPNAHQWSHGHRQQNSDEDEYDTPTQRDDDVYDIPTRRDDDVYDYPAKHDDDVYDFPPPRADDSSAGADNDKDNISRVGNSSHIPHPMRPPPKAHLSTGMKAHAYVNVPVARVSNPIGLAKENSPSHDVPVPAPRMSIRGISANTNNANAVDSKCKKTSLDHSASTCSSVPLFKKLDKKHKWPALNDLNESIDGSGDTCESELTANVEMRHENTNDHLYGAPLSVFIDSVTVSQRTRSFKRSLTRNSSPPIEPSDPVFQQRPEVQEVPSSEESSCSSDEEQNMRPSEDQKTLPAFVLRKKEFYK